MENTFVKIARAGGNIVFCDNTSKDVTFKIRTHDIKEDKVNLYFCDIIQIKTIKNKWEAKIVEIVFSIPKKEDWVRFNIISSIEFYNKNLEDKEWILKERIKDWFWIKLEPDIDCWWM